MFKIIGIGIFGWGVQSINKTDNEYLNLKNTIKNEKIYVYPNDVDELNKKYSFDKEQNNISNNIIIKIPYNSIDIKYPIGKIKLNKIIKKTSPITIIEYNNSRKNKFTNNEIIDKKLFKECVLFPTEIFKHNALNLEQHNKIKLLFDNTITSKSKQSKKLINEYYNSIIKSNQSKDFLLSNNIYYDLDYDYYYDSDYDYNYDYELELNFIEYYRNVYLLVNPYIEKSDKEPTQLSNTKYNIISIGDDENIIIKEKYSNEKNQLDNKYLISIIAIVAGIGLVFVKT
jgi:hypothetical protein